VERKTRWRYGWPRMGIAFRGRARWITLVFRCRDLAVRSIGRLWFSLVWTVGGRRSPSGPSVLAIDSGAVSWCFIDYEELFQSACEYMGPDRVVKVTISDRERYVRQVREQLEGQRVSHYFYDPRSASERPWRSWLQALGLATMFAWRGIIPISRMTDAHHRRPRAQTTLMSAREGVTLALMDPHRARALAVHPLIIGPLPMPLSRKTLLELAEIRKAERVQRGSVVFVGSLYDPRREFLWEVKRRLRQAGVELELKVREPGGRRISNDEYWRTLARADVILSTSTMSFGPGQDQLEETHLIYRFMEACAIGRPLVAQAVLGAEDLFCSGKEFFACTDPGSASEVILAVLGDEKLRERVAETGLRRAVELTEANYFWSSIDRSLDGALSRK